VLRFEALNGVEIARYQLTLNRLRAECGCSSGLGLLVLTAAVLVYLQKHAGGWATLTWQRLTFSLLMVFLSALLGKTAGLAVANLRLARVIRQVVQSIESGNRAGLTSAVEGK